MEFFNDPEAIASALVFIVLGAMGLYVLVYMIYNTIKYGSCDECWTCKYNNDCDSLKTSRAWNCKEW